MKPPSNPLAGTLGGRSGRGLFVPKGWIPGTSRRRRRSRIEYVAHPLDDAVQALGVPVYDRSAQVAELGSYGIAPTRAR